MNEKVEKIKEHFIRNKDRYIVGTIVGITTAGITWLIMRRSRAVLDYVGADCPDTESTDFLSLFSNKFNINSSITNNVVTVIEREGRGHPGYRVRDLDTLMEWDTQGLAAKSLNTTPMVISKHIRGIYPDAKGHHLERIAV